MTFAVNLNNLDDLVGTTFANAGFANVTTTLVNGSLANTAASPAETITYNGTTATIGAAFFPKTVTLEVASVNDTDDTMTLDAYVGTTLVGVLNFTVVGFSPYGIALAAMPLNSLITQSGNLAGLAGQVFELGFNAAGAKTTSVDFTAAGTYNFIQGAGIHYATAANPVLQGGTGPQMLLGLSGDETITAGPNVTIIYGGPGTNTLISGAGKDTIFGGAGVNTIIGGAGTDVLHGTTGTDRIVAGSGHTVLIGGTGTDTFIFAPGHTGGATADTADIIQHFLTGKDTINLTAFDALLPASAGGHMTLIGTAAFDGHAGELRYDVTATGITISGDLNGDGVADFVLTATKIFALNSHELVL